MRFKEFMFGQKKNVKPIEPIVEDEIVDTINISKEIELGTTLMDVGKFFEQVIGRKVTFTPHEKYSSSDMTRVVIGFAFSLKKNDQYAVFFDTDMRMKIPLDTDKDIKIWGKRIKSDDDPYAEEDWTR